MLRALWRGWLRIARKIGQLQSFVLVSLVYFVVIAPFALGVRLFSDPLGLRESHSWHGLPPYPATLNAMRQQSWGEVA